MKQVRIIITLLLCALCLFVDRNNAIAGERSGLYGFAPACPQQLPVFTELAITLPYQKEKNAQLDWLIDDKGKVKAVTPVHVIDTLVVKAVTPYAVSLSFTPATFNGKATESHLLGTARILPESSYPFLSFPTDSDGVVIDRQLYLQTIEANQIILPVLQSFPSYWSSVQIADDTMLLPPVILLRVDLDKAGKLQNVAVVHSTYPAFTSQLVAAATRIKVAPPYVKGKGVPASVFVRVVFYPGNNYPTQPYDSTNVQSLPLRERMQVTLEPDTLGLLPPIPRFNPANALSGGAGIAQVIDTIAIYLTIDATGKTGCLRHDKVSKELSPWIQEAVEHMQFYPAMTFSGEAKSFAGVTYFIFNDSTSVRIEYPWLAR